jgi:hypothetical protein
MSQPTWEDVERQAAQLEVSFEDDESGYITLIKHQGVQGMFQESKAGLAAAIEWLFHLQRMMEIADQHRK